MAASNLIDISDEDHFEKVVAGLPKGGYCVLDFWASWAEQCGQMNDVIAELAKQYPDLTFLKIEAENVPDISEEFSIDAVPSFVILRGRHSIAARVGGADAPALTAAVAKAAKLSSAAVASLSSSKEATDVVSSESSDERFKKLVSQYEVMAFIKGTPSQPRCGFSRQLVEIFKENGVDYGFYNILSNEDVRNGLKTWAGWSTYPMVFVKGELIGGLDIIKELVASGEFGNTIPSRGSLESNLRKLVASAPVMLFMKGLPDAPRCGFSRQIVQILRDEGAEFKAFDILENEEVRNGLKEVFDWPTFPQLYVNGELIGGLDIVKEMVSSGELKSVLAEAKPVGA